jgi:hypothetical protein
MPFAATRRTYGALRASGRSPSRQTVILQRESPARELHLPRGTSQAPWRGAWIGARLKPNGVPVCLFRGCRWLLPKRPLRARAVLWPLGRDCDLRLSPDGVRAPFRGIRGQ